MKILLSPQAQQLVARFRNADALVRVLARAIDKQNVLTVGQIQEKRLTGKGPFPVQEHRLGERSHLYRKSIRHAPAAISGTTIESGIGANVKYAAVHEFGGRIDIPPRRSTLRFKTVKVKGRKEKFDKQGRLVQGFEADSRRLAKQKSNSNLWVFARAGDKTAEETQVNIAGYSITLPERRPVRTGIEERLGEYGAALSRAVVNHFEAKSQ